MPRDRAPVTLLALPLLALCGCGDDLAGGAADLAGPRDLAASHDQRAPDLSSDCGPCPGGYSCGTANGIPVCRAGSGIPRFGHVFLVLMENTSWSTLEASKNTPWLHGIQASAAFATDFHGVTHPSLPNYF